MTAKRNCIPLFGKQISLNLMKKILESNVNKIYIGLDPDALSKSIEYCEMLMSFGKEVYLIELKEGDVNEVGFHKFLNIIQNTYPLTFTKLIQLKIT